MGGRAKAAAKYTPELCEALCRGLVKQKRDDRTGCPGMRAACRRELNALHKELCSLASFMIKERNNTDSSVIVENQLRALDVCPHNQKGSKEYDGRRGDANGHECLDTFHEPDGTHPMHIHTDNREIARFDGEESAVSKASRITPSKLNFSTGENLGAEILYGELRQLVERDGYGDCYDDVSGGRLEESGLVHQYLIFIRQNSVLLYKLLA